MRFPRAGRYPAETYCLEVVYVYAISPVRKACPALLSLAERTLPWIPRTLIASACSIGVCKGYVQRNGVTGATVYMHREVSGASDGETVVHLNGDRRDNRKSNLSVFRSHTLLLGSSEARSASGYKGVSPNGDRWSARIKHLGELRYLGTFDTPEQAARAYDSAARRYRGSNARTNF